MMRAIAGFDFLNPGLDDLHGGLARVFEQMDGEVLPGKFAWDGHAMHLIDRGDEAAEHIAAFEQRDEAPKPRHVAGGGKAGETAADDGNFTTISAAASCRLPIHSLMLIAGGALTL